MDQTGPEVLPYRTDPDELTRWIQARARSRATAQLLEQELAPKTLEGTLATAAALGLVLRDSGNLTPLGERFALADAAERRDLLRRAMHAFPPYARLLQAVRVRAEHSATDARWIETWWATHGHGTSQSNRAEGTATLGRLAEHVGWGKYIPGRRGHPTRIEWSEGAFTPGTPAPEPAARPVPRPPPSAAEPSRPGRAPAPTPAPAERRRGGEEDAFNRIAVPLRSGGVARLELPLRLPRDEKRRLVELLELIIAEEQDE